MKKPPSWPAKPKPRNFSAQHKYILGSHGESLALSYLQARGYQFLARNVRFGHHELDLVMFDPFQHEVVFIEVKTRQIHPLVDPVQALNAMKWRSLYSGAIQFLQKSKLKYDFRFDLVTIVGEKIAWHHNITW